MNILVLNSGSSTLKFQLIATDIERIAEHRDEHSCRGQIERVGGEAIIVVQTGDGPRKKFTTSLPDLSASLEYLVRWIISDTSEISEVRTLADIHAIGNRVVHGGELFAKSVLITDEVLKGIEDCIDLAPQTCELAGFGPGAEIDPDLVEWDYGKYEGRRGAEIRAERPDWNLFRNGCPGGETPQQVSTRADRVVSRWRAIPGDALVFTSGHFMRVLASRWLGLEPTANSRYLMLSTASLSTLGYENDFSRPVIRFWNDTRHVGIEPEVAAHAGP